MTVDVSDFGTYWRNAPDQSTPIEAGVLNAREAKYAAVYAAALAAAQQAIDAAESVSLPTDDIVAGLVSDSAGTSTQAALDLRYGIQVNAASYGAVGDGVTDDTESIRLALAAGASLGRTVLLPAGTYLVTGTLSVPSNTCLVGVANKTILRAAEGSTATPLLLEITGASDVLVRDLIFDGSASANATFQNCCVVYSSTRVRFDSCRWQNVKGISVIFSTNVSLSGVTNSHFQECGTWQKSSGSSDDRRQAIAFSSGTKANNRGNFVVGCTFDEVGLDCVSFSLQSDALLATNRIQKNYAGGFYISNCSFVRAIGNHATGATGGNGIDTSTSDHLTIMGNTCTGRGAGGILVADGTNITVVGNVCTNNNQLGTSTHTGGIVIAGSTANSNIVVSANICTDTQTTQTQTYGVQISATPTNTNLRIDRSNMLLGNATGPVGPGKTGSTSPAWTPTLTNWGVGAGTLTARWDHDSGRIRASIIAVFGSGSTASSGWYFTLPANPSSLYGAGAQIGTWTASDAAGTTVRLGTVIYNGAQGRMFLADGSTLTGTTPFTWGTGCRVTITLDYTAE